MNNNLDEEQQDRVDIVRHKLKFVENKPAVACIAWLEPMLLAGDVVPELVGIAGGVPVLAQPDKPSVTVNWADIQASDPDVIVLMLQGLSVEQSMGKIYALLQLPGVDEMKAVKNNRIYITDSKYFNDDHAAVVDGVEILAEIIHPKQFIFGYEGNAWIKFAL